MHVQVDIAGAEYKTARQLERVCAQTVLLVAGRAGTSAGPCVVAAKKVQNVCRPQTGGSIGEPMLVHQQRERNAGRLAELTRIVSIAQADCGKSRSVLTKGRFVLAQLRDVLAAEDSTVMTQEDDHRRLLVPKGSQPHLVALRIRQDDAGQARAE